MNIEIVRGDTSVTIDCPETPYTARVLTRWLDEANRALDAGGEPRDLVAEHEPADNNDGETQPIGFTKRTNP